MCECVNIILVWKRITVINGSVPFNPSFRHCPLSHHCFGLALANVGGYRWAWRTEVCLRWNSCCWRLAWMLREYVTHSNCSISVSICWLLTLTLILVWSRFARGSLGFRLTCRGCATGHFGNIIMRYNQASRQNWSSIRVGGCNQKCFILLE